MGIIEIVEEIDLTEFCFRGDLNHSSKKMIFISKNM